MTARPKVVQPGRKTKMPKDSRDYPPDRFPYMTTKPYGKPSFHKSWRDAVRHLQDEVFELKDQFGPLDSRIVERCDAIVTAIGRLSQTGGQLDMEVDPYTETRYRVELVLRRSA